MALIETEEAARRLARAIASDLSLYNEEKILEGIQQDTLFAVLAEELEEGRALFKSRVSPELFALPDFRQEIGHRGSDLVRIRMGDDPPVLIEDVTLRAGKTARDRKFRQSLQPEFLELLLDPLLFLAEPGFEIADFGVALLLPDRGDLRALR